MLVGGTFAERWAQSGWFEAMLHTTHPGHDLVVRSVPWSADEVGRMPRELNVPTTLDRVRAFDPDVVFVCFGMAESFTGQPDRFEMELARLCTQLAEREGDARSLVLISPIRHEPGGGSLPAADRIDAHNITLGEHTQAIERVALAAGHAFVDLFAQRGDGLTTNGIHPSLEGCAQAAISTAEQLAWLELDSSREPAGDGEPAPWADLLQACADKFWYERLIYRPTNTEYVWGRRHEPFGVVNFPEEFKQLERMVRARQSRIHALPPGEFTQQALADAARINAWPGLPLPLDLSEDAWTPTSVEAKGTETSLGSVRIAPPEEFLSAFTVAPGYVIECFASERDFPELANPLALTFDHRHRLWVLVAPTYPHLLPGEAPRCKLLILEDRDSDGRADSRTIFADGLYIPTGFAIDTDAVYVGQAPDLLRLRDLDGDDHADTREIVASGFSMPDSHHQLSAFEWDPLGGILLHEGVFGVSGVETPWGVRRTIDAAVWRFDPRSQRLDVMSHCGFANPWGHALDDFGQSLLADASGGEGFSFSHVIHAFDYPRKPGRPGAIHNRGRPTAGAELLASRHFPDDAQGTLLINQSIGFHGTRWDRLIPEGSSWRAEPMPSDLVESSDANFRPVAIETGPDGALYIVDWCNPLIGHMQYSLRDPRRDHGHGRIWRVRHESRALLTPPDIESASALQLVDMLRLPERNTRQLARRRLQTMPVAEARAALERLLALLDANDPLHDRLWLESLWWSAAVGWVDLDRAERVAQLRDPSTRAGAVRVLRHWLEAGDADATATATLLERASRDDDMRVRIEAVVAAGFLPADAGLAILAGAATREMDSAMAVVARETVIHLAGDAGGSHPLVRRIRLEQLPADQLLAEPFDAIVAEVILARSDVPREARLAVARRLGGDAVAPTLLAALDRESRPGARAALLDLLAALPTEALEPVRPRFAASLRDGPMDLAETAAALLLRDAPESPEAHALSPALLIAALARIEPGAAHPASLAAARAAAGELDEPREAVAQLVRHAGESDRDELAAWLGEVARAGVGLPLAAFSRQHSAAMAAAWGLAALGEAGPTAADTATLELGRSLYMDDAVGCARCHGIDGRGLEGFPPLDRSPYLLGAPDRAAAIVIHGLFGPVSMPDGTTLNSAMAPLGALLSDDDAAAVLTFARQSWGNFATPVRASDVARARAAPPGESVMWESRALLEKFPLHGEDVFGLPIPGEGGRKHPSTAASPSALPSTRAPASRAAAGGPPMLGVVSLFVLSGAVFLASCALAAMIFRATRRGST